MAITRAQQVRQMLEDGGMLVLPSKDGKRPGYRNPTKEKQKAEKAAANRERNAAANYQRSQTFDVGKSYEGPTYDEAGLDVKKTGKDDDPYVGSQQMGFVDEKPIVPISAKTTEDFRDKQFEPPTFPPGAKFVTNFFKGPLQAGMTYDRNFFVDRVLKAGRIGITPLEFSRLTPEEQEEVFSDFTKLRNAGLTDAVGNLKSGVRIEMIPFKKADGTIEMREQIIDNRDDGPRDQILFPENMPGDPNQDPDDGGDDDNTQTGIGQAFRLMSRGGSPMDAPKKEGIMMASAPDPMDTRNDMMQNLAIDTFGRPLKDLTEDEIIYIEELLMEEDYYGSKPTSRSNKMMADLDIKSMIDEAKEQLSESRFGKSYDELSPLEQELILEIIRGVGKDVFGERQMPESDRVMAQEGGIMDLETGRQMYFLGKLVKKATRAVKKIAKSPIGKAAILGGAMYFGGGAGAGKLGSFFGKGSFNPLKAISTVSGLAGPRQQTGLSGLGKLLNKFGLADFQGGLTGKGIFGLGGGLLALLPFLSEDDQQQLISNRGVNIDPGYIRDNPYTFASKVDLDLAQLLH